MPVAQLIPVLSARTLESLQNAERAAAEARQHKPLIQSLAAHARKRWEMMRDARKPLEERMLSCLRQRSGEYDPDVLNAIRQQGGSDIFMNLTSSKCRAASAWLRDTLMGTGTDKPWQLDVTPIPELPPAVVERAKGMLAQQIAQFSADNGGMLPPEDWVVQQAEALRDSIARMLHEEARKRAERMETKMEDQLTEGGFRDALSAFFDDLVTFPFAVLKGPVVRKRKVMRWAGNGLITVEDTREEWYRVDPFSFYWAPWSSSIDDGPVIELHKLTRQDLESLIGLDGYDDASIKLVLEQFDGGGLRDWVSNQSSAVAQAVAEGKPSYSSDDADLIYAVQLWDVVTGKLLKEWGVDGVESTKTYPAEIWLVDNVVIRAVLNYDPLGRKPYFVTSYEKVPGKLDGNGVVDMVRDPQRMCNAAARALSNNMGISSGPQVGINISRLPPGESITQMHPWKIWQFQNTDYQDASAPISFFQPPSNAAELMAVFEKFSTLADEYSGIPRYMQGEHQAGVGRTSSGLAMLMSNASKGMKQVVNNIDSDVLQPLLERLYEHNLRYSQDPDLIGDVSIVAKGAASLVAKETAAVRRNEFLQLVLQSPQVLQLVGLPGLAELLRDAAKPLQMNIDRILPTREQVEQQQQMEQQRQAQIQDMMLQAALTPEFETVEFKRDQTGAITGAKKIKPKNLLPDGSVMGGRQSNLNANVVTGENR